MQPHGAMHSFRESIYQINRVEEDDDDDDDDTSKETSPRTVKHISKMRMNGHNSVVVMIKNQYPPMFSVLVSMWRVDITFPAILTGTPHWKHPPTPVNPPPWLDQETFHEAFLLQQPDTSFAASRRSPNVEPWF